MQIWAWLKASKIGLWVGSLATVLIGVWYAIWSYKRQVRADVYDTVAREQQEAADVIKKTTKKHNDKTKEVVRLVPRDWDTIDRMRRDGKKIKIPTD